MELTQAIRQAFTSAGSTESLIGYAIVIGVVAIVLLGVSELGKAKGF